MRKYIRHSHLTFTHINLHSDLFSSLPTQRPYISTLCMYKCEVLVSHQRPTRVRSNRQHTLLRTAHCNLCIAAASCFDCNTRQHTATHCITLHHSAIHCTLQPMHGCGSVCFDTLPSSAPYTFFRNTCFAWSSQWHTATHSATHCATHQRPTRFREHMHTQLHVKPCIYTSAHTNNWQNRRDLPFSWSSLGTEKHYHTLQHTRVQCNTQIHPKKK